MSSVATPAAKAPSYVVYVIELADDAIPPSRRRPGVKGCLYVGQTAHAPEHRFSQHKAAGKLSSRRVARHGLRLRPDLYAHLEPLKTRQEAELGERRLAKALEKEGYVVFYG
jgi:hypothetical protein